MTDIPGTTTISPKKKIEEDLENKIKLETVIDIKKIKRSLAKPTELNFDNIQFKNWVIVNSVLVSLFVIYLCFTSIKFILLIFSGPGIGVASFYFKDKLHKIFYNNDLVIRRYLKL